MGQQSEPLEARKDTRVAIFYYGPDSKVLISNYSVNMSSGGVFIETDKIMPEGTPLIVKFKLPDNETVIACNARVAWVNEPGNVRKPSLPPGMGLQFLDLSLEKLHAIQGYLNTGKLVPVW